MCIRDRGTNGMLSEICCDIYVAMVMKCMWYLKWLELVRYWWRYEWIGNQCVLECVTCYTNSVGLVSFLKAKWLYLDEFACAVDAKHVVRNRFELRWKWCVLHRDGTRVGGMMGVCVFWLWRVVRSLSLWCFRKYTRTVRCGMEWMREMWGLHCAGDVSGMCNWNSIVKFVVLCCTMSWWYL